jgi:RES domain-containing protein
MSITVWRLVHTAFGPTAFDGAGAKENPGRWNLEDIPIVYAAGSAALAVLEVLVGIDQWAFLENYYLIDAKIDESHVELMTVEDLPTDWRSIPSARSTRALGTAWARSRRSVALAVPSAVLPLETVYLLNPNHPDFGSVEIGRAVPFSLDPRLRR